MKILVLEDSQERIEKFKTLFPEHDHDVWFTYEAQECIDLLDTQQWDILFLDHDLGGKVFCPSDENSGYAVACWLSHFTDRMPTLIVVHSMNPIGASSMGQVLPEGMRIPFFLLHEKQAEMILEYAEQKGLDKLKRT